MNKQTLEQELKSYWKNDDMVKHCMKHDKYIQLGEWFVSVCDSKPTIQHEMYYNDEYSAPGTDEESFTRYNSRHMPSTIDTSKYNIFIIKHYCGQTDQKLACLSLVSKYEDTNNEAIKQLSPDEVEAVNNAIKEVQVNYAKRLKTYFKRYSDKITTHGYWANR